MLSSLNHKVLGALGMVGAPVMLVELLLSRTMGVSVRQFGRFDGLLGILYLAGFLSSAVGMRILRATGKGRVAAALFWIQIAGLLLASCQNVLQLFGQPRSEQQVLSDRRCGLALQSHFYDRNLHCDAVREDVDRVAKIHTSLVWTCVAHCYPCES